MTTEDDRNQLARLRNAITLLEQDVAARDAENERLRAAAVSVVAAYGRWEIVSRDGGVNDADDAWYAVGDAIEHDLAPLVP